MGGGAVLDLSARGQPAEMMTSSGGRRCSSRPVGGAVFWNQARPRRRISSLPDG
jgi:hypothetical protein